MKISFVKNNGIWLVTHPHTGVQWVCYTPGDVYHTITNRFGLGSGIASQSFVLVECGI